MRVRLFVVVAARAAEEEQDRLSVWSHNYGLTGVLSRVDGLPELDKIERAEEVNRSITFGALWVWVILRFIRRIYAPVVQ